MNIAKTYWNSFIQLIYPQLCASCGAHLVGAEETICSKCIQEFPYTNEEPDRNYLANKLMALERIAGVYSLCYYNTGSDIEHLIKQLKYRNRKDIGVKLGELLGQKLLNYRHYDYLIPVPLHPKKRKKRGYNQSDFIAQGVAKQINVSIENQVLIRSRNTESQTKKSIQSRNENMKNAFSVLAQEKIKNKRIILVDDVITTGATCLSCAKELNEVGAKEVLLVSVAKADPF